MSQYKHIIIAAKLFRTSDILDEKFSGEIFREEMIAMSAPQMLEALKKAHVALFLSRPINSLSTDDISKHKAAYEAVASVLVDLKEL